MPVSSERVFGSAILASLALCVPAARGEDKALALVPPLIAELQPKLEPAELAWAQSAVADGEAHGRTPSRAWEYAAAGASMLGHDALAAFAALKACELGWRSDTASNAGIALLRLDRLDDAQLFCDRALDMDPGCVFAQEAESAIAIARKDLDGAKRWIEKALALRPEDPDLLYAGAIVAQRSGDAATAKARIRKACGLRPGDRSFSSAQAAIDPAAASAQPPPPAPAADGLAQLVAEVNAHFDRIHELAASGDDATEALWKARGWPIDRSSPPWSQQDLDATLATARKQVTDAEQDFRKYRGAAGYANGKWNFAVQRCVLAWIQVSTKADQAWWSVDPETRVLARSLHTAPVQLYAALDSGARCANIHVGDGVFCYEGLVGGPYAELLDMEKEHGYGRAFWQGRDLETRELAACAERKEGADACKAEAIQRFCQMLAEHIGSLVSSVQASVDTATGEFPRAIAAEVLQTATVTADARDFTRRALAVLRPIGDAKIEAQVPSWTPKAIAEMAQQSFASYFGGMIQMRKEVLAQSKADLVEAQAALGRYIESAREQVRNCGGGNELQPKTLSEEIDALIEALDEAGEFEVSNDVECDVELEGLSIEIKPPPGDGLRPVVDVKVGEGLKLIRGVTGDRRGVGFEASEGEGLAHKVEVSIVRSDSGEGEPEYKGSVEGKLGLGVEHGGVGLACYVVSAGAEVNLRELYENYAEAMKR